MSDAIAICTAEQFNCIGKAGETGCTDAQYAKYTKGANYCLLNSISLSSTFKPIGTSTVSFSGILRRCRHLSQIHPYRYSREGI